VLYDHTAPQLVAAVDATANQAAIDGLDRGFGVQPFVGDGGVVSTVGINLAILGPNLNPDGFNWQVYIWDSLDDLASDFYRDAPPSPNHSFSVNLSNPDRFDQVGTANGLPYYYVEADIGSVGLEVDQGETYAIALVTTRGSGSFAGITFSSGGAGAIGNDVSWFGQENSVGPGPLDTLSGAPASFFSYRITSIPAPSASVLVGIGVIFFNRRRR